MRNDIVLSKKNKKNGIKKKELKYLVWVVFIFGGVIFFMPIGNERFMTAIYAALDLSKWYAQEHVILCLLPAFFSLPE